MAFIKRNRWYLQFGLSAWLCAATFPYFMFADNLYAKGLTGIVGIDFLLCLPFAGVFLFHMIWLEISMRLKSYVVAFMISLIGAHPFIMYAFLGLWPKNIYNYTFRSSNLHSVQWFLIGIAGLVVLYITQLPRMRTKARKLLKSKKCQFCGYSLEGLLGPGRSHKHCPECGKPILQNMKENSPAT